MNNELAELLKNLNDMYSGAFNSLITITLAIVGFIGIIMPIAISFYQNRQLKIDKENLEQSLSELVLEATKELKNEIQSEIQLAQKEQALKTQEELSQIRKKIKRHSSTASGAALHVQGINMAEQEKYIPAIISLQQSALSYTKSKDELNLGRVLEQIIMCYDNANKSIEQSPHDIQGELEILIKRLKKLNKNGGYEDSITKLKASRKRCIEREEKQD